MSRVRINASRALAGVAGMVALVLSVAGCGGDGSGQASGTTSPSTTSAPSVTSTAPSTPVPSPTGETSPTGDGSATPAANCPQRTLERLDLEQRVGQLFMGGVQVDQSPATVSEVLGETQVGSLLFIGQLTGGTAASAEAAQRARAVAGSPGGAEPFVAVDQEGGLVQHLKGPGFSTMPSAEEQGEMPLAQLRDEAESWGDELRAAGVDVNLAPVADVVPAEIGAANEPVGAVHRGFGADTAAVGRHVAAFVEGMAQADVATVVKHFPGLGKVEGNTDFSSGVVDTRTTRDDPDLAPFAAGLDAGAQFVMLSLATYEQIDPDRRAVFSPVVIEQMVRRGLGFDGVVVSDDLGAAAEVQDVPPAQRALDFLAAGGDIVVVATPDVLPEMTQAVIDEAESDPPFAAAVDQHVLRVLTAKEDMGLLSCAE